MSVELEDSKVYINGEGSQVLIRRRGLTGEFDGHSVLNNVYMGRYSSGGAAFGGVPEKANLVKEFDSSLNEAADEVLEQRPASRPAPGA